MRTVGSGPQNHQEAALPPSRRSSPSSAARRCLSACQKNIEGTLAAYADDQPAGVLYNTASPT